MVKIILLLSIFLFSCSSEIGKPLGSEQETIAKQLFVDVSIKTNTHYQFPKIFLKDLKNYEQNCKTNLCQIKGIFENQTIYMSNDFDINQIQYKSYLIHEFVHYIQYKQGNLHDFNTCNERYQNEYDAYKIQYSYLRKNTNFKYDTKTIIDNILLSYTC